MAGPSPIPDEEFIRLLGEFGPAETARKIGIDVRNVYERRKRLEKKLGPIHVQNSQRERLPLNQFPGRLEAAVHDGIVLVGSDAHYWPADHAPVMHRAFVHFIRKHAPEIIVLNGDVMDCATASRHAPIGWEKRPSLIQEIECAQERLDEIVKASPNHPRRIWTLGNHDSRFETRLASVAPEYAKINGVHLRDHFDAWEPCWSVFINDMVVKHRFKGGIHATHNNTLWAGKTMVTGHLHSAKVVPLTDYNGTRWGVDTGCMADTNGRQFEYTEDNPKNWVSAFGVFTFRAGKLMWPELVTKMDDEHVQFRGEVIEV